MEYKRISPFAYIKDSNIHVERLRLFAAAINPLWKKLTRDKTPTSEEERLTPELMDYDQISEEALRETYGQIFFTENTLFKKLAHGELIRWVKEHQTGLQFGIMSTVGTGTLGPDAVLAELLPNATVIATDISSIALARLNDPNSGLPGWLINRLQKTRAVADGFRLPFPDSNADIDRSKSRPITAVVTVNTLHHLAEKPGEPVTSDRLADFFVETARVAEKGICHLDPRDIDKNPLPPALVYLLSTVAGIVSRFSKHKFVGDNLVLHEAVVSYFRSIPEATLRIAVDIANKQLKDMKGHGHKQLQLTTSPFFQIVEGWWAPENS